MRIKAFLLASLLQFAPTLETNLTAAAAQDPMDAFFEEEVWAKVGERTCLNCHRADGDASESDFVLHDARFDPDLLRRNFEAFRRMATRRTQGISRLLAKPTGGLKHGGGPQLKADSTGARILEEFVRRMEGRPSENPAAEVPPSPFFQGVEMTSPRRLLRRVTLSLAGRLPRADEFAAVDRRGPDAMGPLLDGLMKEDAFYDRLREGFNDIFLTIGYDLDVAEAIFSYDHFGPSRLWYQHHDLPGLSEEERKRARGKLATDYRKAILDEPLKLIEFIVRNERPFTEIVTADYIMVTPYTARGLGIFERVREEFQNTDDPFEYVPVRLPALRTRDGKPAQKSATGLYPHAGLLSTFQYLTRYRTTVTNRNRGRARMYFQHFLGIDVMSLAPRVADPAVVSTKFANPTLQAPECVVCHKVIDPVAGLFQDYFKETGDFGPRKGGWFTDMFPPGLEGRDLPTEDRWRALQWLGEETAKDPRFAVAMVEHAYYILMGRRPLLPPQDIEDPLFTPKRRAFREQRRAIQETAARFAKGGFNFKQVLKELIASPFYRADGLAEAAMRPARRAELDDVGVVRLLTPEQLERNVEAIFGARWGRLSDQNRNMAILYGGIDSKEVTERISDPGGAMGAIQRLLANEVASKNVPADFAREPAKRKLFPGVELADVPGTPEVDAKIRRAVAHLHAVVLGREHPVDHPEVERTCRLFSGVLEDLHARGEKKSDDPLGTRRAWRAVVTYLLRTDDFLYE